MTAYVLLGAIGASEALLIIIGILVLFGGKKIPELMKGFGQGISEFKKAVKPEDKEKLVEDKNIEKH